VAVEGSNPPAPPPPPPSAPPPAATAAADPPSVAEPPRVGRPSAAPAHAKRQVEGGGAARGASFSATFARREGEIRRCFVDHANGAATEVSLRFDVDRDGHVSSLAVLPATVASSPLGGCLAAVGKTTVFPRQPSPLTFRIPLTVQREAGSKGGP